MRNFFFKPGNTSCWQSKRCKSREAQEEGSRVFYPVDHSTGKAAAVRAALMGMKPIVLAGASTAFHPSVMQEEGKIPPRDSKGLSWIVRTADAEPCFLVNQSWYWRIGENEKKPRQEQTREVSSLWGSLHLTEIQPSWTLTIPGAHLKHSTCLDYKHLSTYFPPPQITEPLENWGLYYLIISPTLSPGYYTRQMPWVKCLWMNKWANKQINEWMKNEWDEVELWLTGVIILGGSL